MVLRCFVTTLFGGGSSRLTRQGTFQLTLHVFHHAILFENDPIHRLDLSRKFRHFAFVKFDVDRRVLIQVPCHGDGCSLFAFEFELFLRHARQLGLELTGLLFQSSRLALVERRRCHGVIFGLLGLRQLHAQRGFRHGRLRRLTRFRLGRFDGLEQVL